MHGNCTIPAFFSQENLLNIDRRTSSIVLWISAQDADSYRVDPETDGGKLEGRASCRRPVVAGGKASHLIDAIDGALDQVALAVDLPADGEGVLADRPWRDVRPGLAAGDEGLDAVVSQALSAIRRSQRQIASREFQRRQGVKDV